MTSVVAIASTSESIACWMRLACSAADGSLEYCRSTLSLRRCILGAARILSQNASPGALVGDHRDGVALGATPPPVPPSPPPSSTSRPPPQLHAANTSAEAARRRRPATSFVLLAWFLLLVVRNRGGRRRPGTDPWGFRLPRCAGTRGCEPRSASAWSKSTGYMSCSTTTKMSASSFCSAATTSGTSGRPFGGSQLAPMATAWPNARSSRSALLDDGRVHLLDVDVADPLRVCSMSARCRPAGRRDGRCRGTGSRSAGRSPRGSARSAAWVSTWLSACGWNCSLHAVLLGEDPAELVRRPDAASPTARRQLRGLEVGAGRVVAIAGTGTKMTCLAPIAAVNSATLRVFSSIAGSPRHGAGRCTLHRATGDHEASPAEFVLHCAGSVGGSRTGRARATRSRRRQARRGTAARASAEGRRRTRHPKNRATAEPEHGGCRAVGCWHCHLRCHRYVRCSDLCSS